MKPLLVIARKEMAEQWTNPLVLALTIIVPLLIAALVAADEQYKPILRKAGLLTRDPRVKERKKYGLKRARKAPQYTKR